MPAYLSDALRGGVIVFGTPAILVWVLSLILDKFAALSATPDTRAKVTVGIPYLIAVMLVAAYIIAIATEDTDGVPLWIEAFGPPLFPLPGAALIYLHYRAEYRRRWVENADDLPDGVTLANDDWKVGLATLALFALFGVFRVIFRMIWTI
ncbi:MAG: hypothetical protein WBL74_07035 [Novosphingobium sp.]|uniref:hypothetical protein n=1 Tax=Novosphingobium sp. TaxID=1874826 RepID=UPI003C7C7A34